MQKRKKENIWQRRGLRINRIFAIYLKLLLGCQNVWADTVSASVNSFMKRNIRKRKWTQASTMIYKCYCIKKIKYRTTVIGKISELKTKEKKGMREKNEPLYIR